VRLSIDDTELPEAAAALRSALTALRLELVEDVGAADVFVGAYGDRYGPIEPGHGVSRLEQDYLAAGTRPRLVYVLPGDGARDQHLALLLTRIQVDDLASYRRVSGVEELARLAADDVTMVLTEAFTGAEEAPAGEPTSAGPPPRARIPAPWHRMIGRDLDLAEVCRRLRGPARLVTITGPGGIGKSRLAIDVAARIAPDFVDGAWFVDLVGSRDPAVVAPTIAHALGVREAAGALPVESLKSYLSSMSALLLLDSFETVLSAAPLVVDLLAAAPDLRVLVTSRGVLRVRGEHEYSLAPLSVPAAGDTDPATSPALELFLERAVGANPGRVLTPSEQAAAAQICRRLDGVPLSLELAAARTRVLTLAALLGKLERALDVLGSGPVDLPERQRALRTTLDWDHDLLGAEERVVFRRLAVFPRTVTLSAAEAVIGDAAIDVMDGLDGLVGKSLVRSTAPHPISHDPEFVMIQTVHDYAHERLVASGEHEEVHARHAHYVLERAEQATAARPVELDDWLAALEHEHSDLRVALDWADRALQVDVLLRLVAALGKFWMLHSHFSEGRRWVERALALSAGQRTALRAEILDTAGALSRARGVYEVAEAQYREALAIREELGDPAETSAALRHIGNIAYDRGDVDGADDYWHRSLALLEGSGDDVRRMSSLNNLGVLAHHRGEQETAIQRFEEALGIATRLAATDPLARAQMNVAIARNSLGQHEQAREMARSAVVSYAALEDTWDLVDALDTLAGAVGPAGEVELAAFLFGGANALRAALDVRRPKYEQREYLASVAAVREMDPDAYDRGYGQGARASLDQIVARATGGGR
jgi:predicted ATPase